jgi:hypothetical protein
MQHKKHVAIVAVSALLLIALVIGVSHWLAEPAVAEPERDGPAVREDGEKSAAFDDLAFNEVEDEGEEEDEGDDEEGDDDRDVEEVAEELELHRRHLDVEMGELETQFGRLELVGRLAEIAHEEIRAAAFAIAHVQEFMDEEEAIEFLNEALADTKNAGVRRMIRIKLAELHAHAEQRDEALEHVRALIVGE